MKENACPPSAALWFDSWLGRIVAQRRAGRASRYRDYRPTLGRNKSECRKWQPRRSLQCQEMMGLLADWQREGLCSASKVWYETK